MASMMMILFQSLPPSEIAYAAKFPFLLNDKLDSEVVPLSENLFGSKNTSVVFVLLSVLYKQIAPEVRYFYNNTYNFPL